MSKNYFVDRAYIVTCTIYIYKSNICLLTICVSNRRIDWFIVCCECPVCIKTNKDVKFYHSSIV